ncbi:nuclear transport factor 2 family protein [Jeongeupia wiesaeckerbachi]|uniref:nuclear transport factor 2 family protein n=1 Tax=Jeongeupia wiesaeckerbachi TaxID=3051218 RepID=UPI003D800CA7
MNPRYLLIAAMVMLAGAAQAEQCASKTCNDIVAVAHDYTDGWYNGDGPRMKRAIYEKLVKREIPQNGDKTKISDLSPEGLVFYTAKGTGATSEPGLRRNDVKVLDIYNGMAMVRVDMQDWVDYMQMAKIDGRWQIVNVIWSRHSNE